jgi:hypothetical protein
MTPKPQANKLDEQYTKELEKLVIWLCNVYTQTQDSLGCHETDGGTDENWMKIFMTVPTIQGTHNRFMVKRIGELRTRLGNREGFKLNLDDVYEKLKENRKENN